MIVPEYMWTVFNQYSMVAKCEQVSARPAIHVPMPIIMEVYYTSSMYTLNIWDITIIC